LPSDLLPTRIDTVVRRILIVDDSRRFRELAAELLATQGFEVFEDVADGEQALAAVVGECPDGILLDISLPGLDGFTVASSLAAACPGVTIVLASAAFDYVPADLLKISAAAAFVPKDELAVTDLTALFAA
jgi:CheY-like chemotaxis protein